MQVLRNRGGIYALCGVRGVIAGFFGGEFLGILGQEPPGRVWDTRSDTKDPISRSTEHLLLVVGRHGALRAAGPTAESAVPGCDAGELPDPDVHW